MFTAPGHQPPAPLSSPLHPRNASWNSKPAEPWRSQRFREISFIYIFLWYVYILHDMFHDILIAELEVKCLPGRRSPSDEFPFNLLWTSFRMMEDSPWERKHFELPWGSSEQSCKNFRVKRGLGGYTVKISENMWKCWCSAQTPIHDDQALRWRRGSSMIYFILCFKGEGR